MSATQVWAVVGAGLVICVFAAVLIVRNGLLRGGVKLAITVILLAIPASIVVLLANREEEAKEVIPPTRCCFVWGERRAVAQSAGWTCSSIRRWGSWRPGPASRRRVN